MRFLICIVLMAGLAGCGSGVASQQQPTGGAGAGQGQAGGAGQGSAGTRSEGTSAQGGAPPVYTKVYSSCMRAHGMPRFPDPDSHGQISMSGINPGSADFQNAQRACQKYGPVGNTYGSGSGQGTVGSR